MSVALENISKSFKTAAGVIHALQPTTFTIKSKEKIGICGPSGAGKSTLLNVLGLAETPTSGDIFFEGTKVSFNNESQIMHLRRYYLGYVFQYFNLIPSMTALENVMLPLLLQKIEWNVARQKADDMLAAVSLQKRKDSRCHQLSGGEMQRVGIARALVHSPKMVLADEPTGNLDSKNGSAVLELLQTLSGQGASIVMVSHSTEALSFCSRIIELVDGTIKQS